MAEVPDYLQSLYAQLSALPVVAVPAPWKEHQYISVGGLTDVAFAKSSDLLLVLSVNGRGLFDCLTGTRLAREPSEDFDFDTSNLEVDGIGSVVGQRLRTAGVHGGGLALTTKDGWSIDMHTLSWPHQSLFLTPPGHWVFDPAFGKIGQSFKIAEDSEIRVFGFSPTGRSFIIGTGSDLLIYFR